MTVSNRGVLFKRENRGELDKSIVGGSWGVGKVSAWYFPRKGQRRVAGLGRG